MNISISIDELKRLLTAMPTDQNIMLTGRHGIGKSEILTNFYAERGMKVVTLFLGQMSDPGDLIGLPNKKSRQERPTLCRHIGFQWMVNRLCCSLMN